MILCCINCSVFITVITSLESYPLKGKNKKINTLKNHNPYTNKLNNCNPLFTSKINYQQTPVFYKQRLLLIHLVERFFTFATQLTYLWTDLPACNHLKMLK